MENIQRDLLAMALATISLMKFTPDPAARDWLAEAAVRTALEATDGDPVLRERVAFYLLKFQEIRNELAKDSRHKA